MLKNYLTKNNRLFRSCLPVLFGLLSFGAYAQNITVTGMVSDSDGPLAGVSVQLKGTSVGTVTDIDGGYAVSAPQNGVLVFSFIGMNTQEIPVGGKSRLDVILTENAILLEDVVVIGYGTLEKKMVSSAVTSISAKDLVTGVGGATIANALKGKVSGLVMSGTDSPNATNDLQLRGMASLENSRSPLVVIDGMPGGDIRSVVQEDIQSIDILKDASAGAIYGTRATGGVILITTKRAQEGKTRISYTGETTYKETFGKPNIMSTKEYLRNFNRAIDYEADTDWWDEGLAENPFSTKHLLSLNGGNEGARVYANVMYEKNNGILRGDSRTDFGGHINANFKAMNGWVELNTTVDYRQANRDQSKPDTNILLALNPSRAVKNANDPSGYNVWTVGNEVVNNIADADLNTDNTLDKWFRPGAELIINILPVKGLSLHVTGSYENRQAEIHKYTSMYSSSEQRTKRKGYANLKFSKRDNFNTESYLSLSRQFDDHFVSAVAGYSYYETGGEEFEMSNANFSVDALKYWKMESGSWLKEGNADMKSRKSTKNKLLGYFGRAHYNWKGKYMAMATIRREGSSKFVAANAFGTFWSLSGGWRISSEEFMKNVTAVNDLKLRAGYGVTGNEGFDRDYNTYLYGLDLFWMMPSGEFAPGLNVATVPSPTLQWEEKHEWNLGLDYSLFNNRLFGKIDLYQRNIEKLLYKVSVPMPPNVVSDMYENIATLVNRGWEFEIGGKIVKTKDWDYETAVNLSHNVTSVDYLSKDKSYQDGNQILYNTFSHRLQVGQPVGSYFLYKHAGFESNGDGKSSDFRVLDAAGNSIPHTKARPEDRVFAGNYTPLVIAGWTHNLRYKNWTLNMTLTSWIDFDVFNGIDYNIGYAPLQSSDIPYNRLRDAFGKHNHIRTNGLPSMSDYFLEDGTFLKIQNVSLGYTLDSRKWSNDLMDHIRFYLTGNNLYTFTKYSGYNPEVTITGWQGGIEDKVYPQTRSYVLGVQFNF
ncbi:MAG: SusC/RagA family TonB-linked outer membrane protein [Dysgonamonadaceae bacterium]|nr:SusC/RagA family TonB-linked outer membrane protein [Dysgonamonadaceae bacterium]